MATFRKMDFHWQANKGPSMVFIQWLAEPCTGRAGPGRPGSARPDGPGRAGLEIFVAGSGRARASIRGPKPGPGLEFGPVQDSAAEPPVAAGINYYALGTHLPCCVWLLLLRTGGVTLSHKYYDASILGVFF